MSDSLQRLDRVIYRCERAFVVTALLGMALVVFLDVVYRTFAAGGSKALDVYVKLAGWFGRTIEPGSAAHESAAAMMPWVAFALFAGLAWSGIRTGTRPRPLSHPVAAALGVGGTVVVYGLIQLLLRVLPNGLIWSQNFALVLTLWVGFLGASMAAHDNKHLRVEAVQRHIPPSMRKWVAAASAGLTTAFCFGLMFLSLRYIAFNYDEYESTEHLGGIVQGMSLPKYIAFIALPLSFAVMAARFAAQAVAAMQGRLKETDALDGLVDDATKAAVAASLASSPARVEADIPTEAVRAIPDDVPEPAPKVTSAPAVRAGEVVVAQSEVVTDRHDAAADEADEGDEGAAGGEEPR